MIVVFTGGRKYFPTHEDFKWVFNILSDLARDNGPLTIVTGGARGVDAQIASYISILINNPEHDNIIESLVVMRANWQIHGPAAGVFRNQEMINNAQALIAFPGGRGTEDCVKRARRKGILIIEHPERKGK